MSDERDIPVHPKTKAAIVITWGDADDSGKPDLTVQTFGVIPFARGGFRKLMDLGPFNVPLDEVQTVTMAAIASLPVPAPAKAAATAAVAGVFAVLRIAL